MGTEFTSVAYAGVTGMMTFGTGTMVSSKVLLDMRADGCSEKNKNFNKPLYQTVTMFIAMSGALLIYEIQEFFASRKHKSSLPTPSESAWTSLIKDLEHPDSPSNSLSVQKEFEGNIESVQKEENLSSSPYFLIFIPAFIDLIATTLMTFGLIFISVSIMQMLRGSMIIFSAVLSIIFLKKKLFYYHWLGIIVCVIALILVGLASVESAKSDVQQNWHKTLLGCLMVVFSQFIQACQIVVEEHFLHNVHVPPLIVVGLEGVWGTLISFGIFTPLLWWIPGTDNGKSFEDPWDTIVMMKNSSDLVWGTIIYLICILMYNWSGMMVTSELSAVHRTIFEAVRTIAIWLVDLFIYYSINNKFGEVWNNWSYLQLGGFIMLILGMAIYNKLFLIPGFSYEEEENQYHRTSSKENLVSGIESPRSKSLPIAGRSQEYGFANDYEENVNVGSWITNWTPRWFILAKMGKKGWMPQKERLNQISHGDQFR